MLTDDTTRMSICSCRLSPHLYDRWLGLTFGLNGSHSYFVCSALTPIALKDRGTGWTDIFCNEAHKRFKTAIRSIPEAHEWLRNLQIRVECTVAVVKGQRACFCHKDPPHSTCIHPSGFETGYWQQPGTRRTVPSQTDRRSLTPTLISNGRSVG